LKSASTGKENTLIRGGVENILVHEAA
jgi:hypothetical protein